MTSHQAEEMETLSAEADKLTAEIKASRAEILVLEEKKLFSSRKVAEMKQRLEEKETELERKEAEYETYIGRCKEFLGLEIDVINDEEFAFSFRGLSDNDEDAKAVVSVATSRVDGEKSFRVTGCEPQVEFGAIENALNATGELNGFVVAMRKKFMAAIGKR